MIVTNNTSTHYAGFGRRLVAEILDAVIFIALPIIGLFAATISYHQYSIELFFRMFGGVNEHRSPLSQPIYYAIHMTYIAGFTASKWQATPAKKLLGIKIGGVDGSRLSFIAACKRYVWKYLPSIIITTWTVSFYFWQSHGSVKIYLYAAPLLYLAQGFWFLPILLTSDKRAVYDTICHTRVFRKYPKPQGKFSRVVGWCGAGLVITTCALAATVVLINYWNQPLNKNLANLLRNDDDYITLGNGFYAFAGLNAPKNIIDIHAYAVKNYEERKRLDEAKIKKLRDKNALSLFQNLFDVWSDTSFIAGYYDPKATELTFAGDKKLLYCWEGDGTKNTKNNAQNTNSKIGCATTKQVNEIMKDNALLIKRYYSFYHYPRFSDAGLLVYVNGVLIININDLLIADMQVLAKSGKVTEALDKWIANVTFLRKVISDRQNFLGKSIFMVPLNMNLRILPIILNEKPSLIKSYKAKLQNVLAPLPPKAYNIPAVMRSEYDVYNLLYSLVEKIDAHHHLPALFLKADASRNHFYDFASDMIDLSNKPAPEFEPAKAKINEKYRRIVSFADLYNPVGGIVGNLTIQGEVTGVDLFKAMHKSDATVRMLNLYLEILEQKIPKAHINDFLASDANKGYRNPFTNQPFIYDATGNRIFYPSPDAPQVEYEVKLPGKL